MNQEIEQLTLQENALAAAMIRKVGDTTVNFAIRVDGVRQHATPNVTEEELAGLVTEFRQDPKESLAWARESLGAIYQDDRLTDYDKKDRLDRYLDAYTDLTVKLDHAAFPPTTPGQVMKGVPEYIPDGFVDMGGERSLDPDNRNREMIHVDKREIFEQYKPILTKIFSYDFGEMSLGQRKTIMFTELAKYIYKEMPHVGQIDMGGGKVSLGQLSEGVCRHQSLVFQVLAQALGLKSTMLKSRVEVDGEDLGRHASNMVRVDGDWYTLDVSIPDSAQENGRKVWHPGVMRATAPPKAGESKVYEGTLRYSGVHRKYRSRNDMYWTIEPALTANHV